ncbi:MAG: YihA family ribosome biogenesis GTP-binding protein [Clostridia bacterium]|nr:YihA family ribosome biogenesis GTP-binding protein [Clostridia bacterium]
MLNTQNVRLRISAGRINQFPGDPLPQVCFSGRSNVGKSSLINTLMGQKKLARVSSAPGKTITINFFEIDRRLFFVDLPGYGFAKRPPAEKAAWSALTDGYFTQNKNIDRLSLVLQLVDSRIGPTADDEMMMDFLRQSALPYVVVLTKTDKLNKTEYNKMLADMAEHPLTRDVPRVPFSSLSGAGKNELWKLIYEYTGL